MKYDDIINILHWEPKNHPRMSIENRSSIFAPFSALSGYHEAIIETGREVSIKHELSIDEEAILNEKLVYLRENINNQITVSVTYFVKDLKKDGGIYLTKNGVIDKIDLDKKYLRFSNKEKINLENILDITYEEEE